VFERVPVEGTLLGDVARNIEPVLENDPDKARVYSEEASRCWPSRCVSRDASSA